MALEAKKGFRAPEVTSQATTPTSGERLLYPKADGWYEKTSAGVESKVGPSAGGGGGTAGGQFDLTTEYSTTQPATPASGLTIFARHKARRLLAQVGPAGLDTPLQPGLFSNRVSQLKAINNVPGAQLDGLVITNVVAPTAVAVASTNFFTSMIRHRYSSTNTAGTAGGVRTTTAQWFLSSTANMGGFFLVVRFGLNGISATNRLFVGMSATTAALAPATEPSAYLNMVGFACNSAQPNFYFMSNDASGTATQVNLGSSFPTNVGSTNFYEARLFAPSGGGQNVSWSLQRLNDGAFAQGQATTDLPALGTLLAIHVHHANGTTAGIVSTDVQNIYIESDN